jgi:hypothetical protein
MDYTREAAAGSTASEGERMMGSFSYMGMGPSLDSVALPATQDNITWCLLMGFGYRIVYSQPTAT